MTATATPPSGDLKGSDFHPLELIPIFRRIPPSLLRSFVYTIIWNTLFALFFTLLNLVFDSRETFVGSFWPIFVFSQCIGFAIFALFDVGDRLLPGVTRRNMGTRVLYYSIVPLIGTFAGYWLGSTLLHFDAFRSTLLTPRGAVVVGSVSLILSTILLLIFIPRERAARLEAAVEREEARVAAAEREAMLAQLKLLEAQVEPHFLYNTLANVVSLIDSDPATAKRMLDRLIKLLRGTAAAAGNGGATLSAQIEDLRAYLDLMGMRMGGRLTFAIDVPPELSALHVPPLLLQPLVENAIRHGLEPKVEGGAVRIVARRTGDVLEVVVADTGVGFASTRRTSPAGTGLGLPNVRERLAALFGQRAALIVEDNEPAGARVTLRVPVAEPA